MAHAGSEERNFAGIKVSALTRPDLLGRIERATATGTPLTITFLNPDYARRALRNRTLATDISGFDLVLVDGNGVRLLTPLFGFRTPERLDTDSVAPDLFELLAAGRRRLYLFGCAPGVAETAGARIAHAFPGVVIAGTDHGFYDVQRGHPGTFDDEDSERIVRDINAAGADFVLVSLPTPLQQRWVREFGGRLEAPVVMTGGSYLDHVAANQRFPGTWYPPWANRLRLNWFYRLIREPGRLWRRYTLEILDFVKLTVKARLERRSGR